MLTDPVAELLTRIRNANQALHPELVLSSSRLREAVTKLLAAEGFIDGYEVIELAPERHQLKIKLRYVDNRRGRVIKGLRRISKPGRRVYRGRQELPRVQGGMGIAIVSTSQGVLTDREARRRGLGGEILCEVW